MTNHHEASIRFSSMIKDKDRYSNNNNRQNSPSFIRGSDLTGFRLSFSKFQETQKLDKSNLGIDNLDIEEDLKNVGKKKKKKKMKGKKTMQFMNFHRIDYNFDDLTISDNTDQNDNMSIHLSSTLKKQKHSDYPIPLSKVSNIFKESMIYANSRSSAVSGNRSNMYLLSKGGLTVSILSNDSSQTSNSEIESQITEITRKSIKQRNSSPFTRISHRFRNKLQEQTRNSASNCFSTVSQVVEHHSKSPLKRINRTNVSLNNKQSHSHKKRRKKKKISGKLNVSALASCDPSHQSSSYLTLNQDYFYH